PDLFGAPRPKRTLLPQPQKHSAIAGHDAAVCGACMSPGAADCDGERALCAARAELASRRVREDPLRRFAAWLPDRPDPRALRPAQPGRALLLARGRARGEG